MGNLYQQPASVINLEGAFIQTMAVHNYHVCHAAKMKIKNGNMTCVASSKIFFV